MSNEERKAPKRKLPNKKALADLNNFVEKSLNRPLPKEIVEDLFSIKAPREFWVGFTESGFAQWLTPKEPGVDNCGYAFIPKDHTQEPCTEYAAFIEKSAYDALQKERDKANYNANKVCDENLHLSAKIARLEIEREEQRLLKEEREKERDALKAELERVTTKESEIEARRLRAESGELYRDALKAYDALKAENEKLRERDDQWNEKWKAQVDTSGSLAIKLGDAESEITRLRERIKELEK